MEFPSIPLSFCALLLSGTAYSDIMVYPANGQDKAPQQQAEQAQQTNANNKATFDRAYGVCMQGRGDTVS